MRGLKTFNLVLPIFVIILAAGVRGEPPEPAGFQPERCESKVGGLAIEFPNLNMGDLQLAQGQMELALRRLKSSDMVSGFLVVPSTLQSRRVDGHGSMGSYLRDQTSAERKLREIMRAISAPGQVDEVAALDLFFGNEMHAFHPGSSYWIPTTYILFRFKMTKPSLVELVGYRSVDFPRTVVSWFGFEDPRLKLPQDKSPLLSRSRWKMEEIRTLDFIGNPKNLSFQRRLIILSRRPMLSEINISTSPIGMFMDSREGLERPYFIFELSLSVEGIRNLVEDFGTELTGRIGPISWVGFMLQDIPQEYRSQ